MTQEHLAELLCHSCKQPVIWYEKVYNSGRTGATCELCDMFLTWPNKDGAYTDGSFNKKRRTRRMSLSALWVGDKCRRCGRAKMDLLAHEWLEGHHIVRVCDGGDDEIENLETVCNTCHLMIHSVDKLAGAFNGQA